MLKFEINYHELYLCPSGASAIINEALTTEYWRDSLTFVFDIGRKCLGVCP
jgi:hypothetical protein